MPYEVRFEPAAVNDFKSFSAYYRALITDTIEEQLTHTPTLETRNRVRLRENPFADWELRIDAKIRVFYSVNEAESQVRVLRIGQKEGERLLIGGKEYQI